MKSAEREALIKSFSLFFISLSTLFAIIIYYDYSRVLTQKEEDIYRKMKVCSYNLDCKEYKMDFVDINESHIDDKLSRDSKYLYADFDIPASDSFRLRIELPRDDYLKIKQKIIISSIYKYILSVIVSAILSLLFYLYSLLPLKNALHTTEEFARDILHDFNTPLSVIRLNSASLRRKVPQSKALDRIDKSIDNIVALQQNLREFLDRRYAKEQRLDLETIIKERAELVKAGYPNTKFNFNIPQSAIMTRKREFTRIIDNILENAAKYAKEDNAVVNIRFDNESMKLFIEDNGIGIKEPNRVFERFYRESKRQGSGLGMNIVKKLSTQLGIDINIERIPEGGTRVELDLSNIILKGISAR